MNANKQLIDGVLARMGDSLTAEQMTLLEAALIVNLHGCKPETTQIYIDGTKTAVRAAFERCT